MSGRLLEQTLQVVSHRPVNLSQLEQTIQDIDWPGGPSAHGANFHANPSRLRRFAGACATVLALSGGATLLDTLPAAADVGVHHVYDTDGQGLWLHPGSPTLHSGVSDLMADGTEFDPACFRIGAYVDGDNVWQYGINTATGNKGYAADKYIDTNVTEGNEVFQLEAQGEPECGTQQSSTESNGGGEGLQPAETMQSFVSFDRNAAASWALAHAEDTPPNAGSCTDFASQALAAGGFPQDESWNLNFYGIERNGYVRYGSDDAWITPNFVAYMSSLPYVKVEHLGKMSAQKNDIPDARPGDILVYDWDGDGTPDHVDVVVGASESNPEYPLVAGWSEDGFRAVHYNRRGWTWSELHNTWLQDEPGQSNMTVTLLHIETEDDLNISVGN